MVCHATTCRMARNPSRVAVKRREVGGLQGEAFSALDLSEIGCVESHPTRISGRSSVDPAPRRCHCRHFQGQNRHFQGRRRRNFHTRQIRKSLGGFSKISRHANRNKITVSVPPPVLHGRGAASLVTGLPGPGKMSVPIVGVRVGAEAPSRGRVICMLET